MNVISGWWRRLVLSRSTRRDSELWALLNLALYDEAIALAERELKRLGPVRADMSAMEATLRVDFLFGAAQATRKATGDDERELAYLEQCPPLMRLTGGSPAAPDSENFFYMVHMNIGNAHLRLRRFVEASRAHEQAYQFACEPETRLKSLVLLGWDLLQSGDSSRLAAAWQAFARATDVEREIGEHDPEGVQDGRLPLLRSALLRGESLQRLDIGDLKGARAYAQRALQSLAGDREARRLVALLDSGQPTLQEVLRELFAEGDVAAKVPQAIRPLPLDI